MKSLSWVHLNWLILQRMSRAVCFRLQSFDLQNMDAGPSAAIIFNLARCVCKTSRTYRDPTVERTDRFETLARDGAMRAVSALHWHSSGTSLSSSGDHPFT